MGLLSNLHWLTRRYRLPTFDSTELDIAIKSWIEDYGLVSISQPKVDLFKLFRSNAYAFGKSSFKAAFKSPTLHVGHRDGILYVFSTSGLPAELSNIFDGFFVPFVTSKGGALVEETPLAFSTSVFVISPLSYFEKLKVSYTLKVHVEPELKRVPAATEVVRLSSKVGVSVKRSRTIKRTVELTRSEKQEAGLEVGLKLPSIDLLKATIKSEVQNQFGRSSEETETVEYTVILAGDESPAYELAWADLMRVGIVEIDQDGVTTRLPFSYRERTELEVIPVESPEPED